MQNIRGFLDGHELRIFIRDPEKYAFQKQDLLELNKVLGGKHQAAPGEHGTTVKTRAILTAIKNQDIAVAHDDPFLANSGEQDRS